jgi:NAD(P)-dependent dehydrogenase (short-subunit alcohol dehydrogenase family)
VDFDDLNYSFRSCGPFGAYGQSKTANVLFAVEATRGWAGDGITAYAVNPGGVATELQRHVGGGEYMQRALPGYAFPGHGPADGDPGSASDADMASG